MAMLSIRFMFVAVACLPACAASTSRLPAATPHKELAGFRLLVKSPANATWSYGDCAQAEQNLRSRALTQAQTSLSRAGFVVVTDASQPHDAEATVSVDLSYCGGQGQIGSGTISISPGGSATGRVNLEVDSNCDWQSPAAMSAPEGGTCFDPMAQQLAEMPAIVALASKARQQPQSVAENREDSAPGGSPSSASPSPVSLSAGSAQRNAFALAIGIEEYRDVAASATGARADAERFAVMAKTTLGIPEDHVKLAIDDHAALADIGKLVSWVGKNVPPGGRVYFFYSGHGAPQSSGVSYLLPYDGDPADIEHTGIQLSALLQDLGKSRAGDVVAFVDACFSGAGGRSVLPPGARPLVRVKEASVSSRVALMTSASGSEISGPNATGSAGLFSSLLLEGMGRGLADHDGDGAVSLQELVEWVKPRVTREAKKANRDQTPQLIAGSGVAPADVILASGLTSGQ